jgi:hypothetical protein
MLITKFVHSWDYPLTSTWMTLTCDPDFMDEEESVGFCFGITGI